MLTGKDIKQVALVISIPDRLMNMIHKFDKKKNVNQPIIVGVTNSILWYGSIVFNKYQLAQSMAHLHRRLWCSYRRCSFSPNCRQRPVMSRVSLLTVVVSAEGGNTVVGGIGSSV